MFAEVIKQEILMHPDQRKTLPCGTSIAISNSRIMNYGRNLEGLKAQVVSVCGF